MTSKNSGHCTVVGTPHKTHFDFFAFSATLACLMKGIGAHLEKYEFSCINKNHQKLLVYMTFAEMSDFA